jgi:hypothetical protein
MTRPAASLARCAFMRAVKDRRLPSPTLSVPGSSQAGNVGTSHSCDSSPFTTGESLGNAKDSRPYFCPHTWLRGLLNEPPLSWDEVVKDPRHALLREIAEQLAEAALEGASCEGADA